MQHLARTLMLGALVALAAGCTGNASDPTRPLPSAEPDGVDPSSDPAGDPGRTTAPDGMPDPGSDDGYAPAPPADGELTEEWRRRLEERTVDYSTALRTASLILRGDLPSLAEIRFVGDASDQQAAYAAMIDSFLEDPRFTRQLLAQFRDTFKMGGGDLESAPVFAAQLVVEERDFTQLFTATSGNCPTYDGDTATFTSQDCDSGAPQQAGVLTNPDVMRHFFSNLAFRRVRWVQETFACRAFPAESSGMAADVGGEAPYTAPWPFESIAGADTGGRIDFHDVSSVICANCHATMNHIAPLFAQFDDDGMWQGEYAVPLPLEDTPMAQRTDYLPEGEGTAWRLGVPVDDLAELGAAMAADTDVAHCTVARMWNWAFGKGDIVATLSTVPESVLAPYVDDYVGGGHQLKQTIRAIFTSEDFVRF